MKKFFTLFVLAILACLNAAAQFVPEDGKQYVIKDTRSDYFIVLAVGNDSQASDTDNTTQASLGVTGTPFTFTPSGNGFVLSTDEGKYLGIGARPWNVGTTSSQVWTVNYYEESTGRCLIYQNGASKGLGVDNHTIGSGIYTDKSGQYWQIVEYVAPEETHHVTATLDGETVNMLEDGEGGYLVTYPEVQTGNHTVVVSYDGEETSYSFTTGDYKVGDVTVSVGKVTVSYKDGEITVTGDGVGAPVGPVDPVVPTTTFKGVVTHNLTSVSSLEELEGIQLTFVDADQVSVLEDAGDGIYVENEDGSEFYAIWHPLWGGTYEVNGNVVTLHNFFSDNSDGYFSELPAGKATLYFEDFGTFGVNNADEDWDGYIKTFSVAFEGAPAPVPFELIVKNNNIVCANGAKVEAAEAGVASDFYLGNQGLTAVGKTATLYKDGSAMSFSYTMVSNTGISFFGGSSQITEPGTYILEVPAGTYVDAEGNPSVAFYGQWVVIEKEPTYVEPVLKAEDVSAEVAYYIYTTARGGLTVTDAEATGLVGTKEEGVGQTVDPTDVRQQFAFVNWEGQLYLYNLATEKFLGKGDTNKGLFTEKPVDPILFKNAGNGTVMLYFDNDHNINLGGSKQVTIDNWKSKDGGNSFIIKVAEAFDQTAIFERLAATEWNGNVNYSEAASVEDLLNLTVEFEEAASVEASGYDVLGVLYDGVEPYAIVLANGTFDVFGGITFEGSKAKVTFQKIADLDVNAQASAKAAALKIGGFQPQAGKASVVFAGKSFVVDGQLVAGALSNEYEFNGGTVTGIETIATQNGAQIFDLQGRRVRAAQQGIFVVNGKKVVK